MSAQTQTPRHTVTVHLSQSAQAAAARAGQPAHTPQVWDLTADQLARALDLGAKVGTDGCVTLTETTSLAARPADAAAALDAIAAVRAQEQAQADADLRSAISAGTRTYNRDGSVVRAASPAAAAEYRAWLDAQAAKQAAAEQAEREALRARILPELTAYLGRGQRPAWLDGAGATRGHDAEWRCLTDDERDAIHVEDDRRRAGVKDAADRIIAARLSRLAALAGLYGDATVRGRIAAGPAPLGLLPEDEALDIVRDAVLPAGGDAPAGYRKLDRDDIDDHEEREYEDGCGGKMSYVAPPATELDAAEWRGVQAVRAALASALPEASRGALPGEILRHSAECTCDGSTAVTRLGLRLTVDLGDGVTVTREYAIREAAAPATANDGAADGDDPEPRPGDAATEIRLTVHDAAVLLDHLERHSPGTATWKDRAEDAIRDAITPEEYERETTIWTHVARPAGAKNPAAPKK